MHTDLIYCVVTISGRLHVPIVGPTGRSDWSVRMVGPTLRPTVGQTVEESNTFDFVRPSVRPVGRSVYTIRSSDRPVDPTGLSDWSVRRSCKRFVRPDRWSEQLFRPSVMTDGRKNQTCLISSDRLSDRLDEAFTGCLHVPIVCPTSRTKRLHDTIVGPTGWSDWSVRLVGPTIV